MAHDTSLPWNGAEYPARVDLRQDIYRPFPIIQADAVSASGLDPKEATEHAVTAVNSLNQAIQANDAEGLAGVFFSGQSFWRDILAFTYHCRTFNDKETICPTLLELQKARGSSKFTLSEGSVHFVPATPVLKWIEFAVTFSTASPAATCSGRIMLLPERREGEESLFEWKIWSLSTWLERFDAFPENISGLQIPGRDIKSLEEIETPVFIIGGGSAGIVLAARLKALGIESLIADKWPQVGDNWAKRYDCLRFHVHKTCCDTPYLFYPDEVPQLPNRVELAEHMQRYAAAFHLNVLTSTTIKWTAFDPSKKTWYIWLQTPSGVKKVTAKHFVQATGIGASKGYIPDIPGKADFDGINIHSVEFKSGKDLAEKGAKSVIVVGSANTGLDVLEDCHNAGLETTIVARSPTLVFPWEYCLDPNGLGRYEVLPAEEVDNMLLTGPVSIGGQLTRDAMAFAASQEPNRYDPLAKAGFPVFDCTDPRADVTHNLYERAGGHYNEIGDAIRYIVEGKVGVKGGVHPVSYTNSGLRFSDGSTVDADAIVWCTGFADHNVRDGAAHILGGDNEPAGLEGAESKSEGLLTPQDIAARLDGTWGFDAEGEIRGLYKRHLRIENMWTAGGTTTQHRFWSRFVALQIKASLEGTLPEAYREAVTIRLSE